MYPTKFEDLIIAFHRLPGVGMKTAERYAYAVLDWEPEILDSFLQAVEGLKKINHCKICGNLSESEICEICSDESRDPSVICVVKDAKDVTAIENMKEYHGYYHVLNGTINTQKGIMPDKLNIDTLLPRLGSDKDKEVILALDPNIQGETTALYIEKLIGDQAKVTRLAYGIPVGGQLDYADTKTLAKAFEGRK